MRVWRGVRVLGLLAAALVAADCALPAVQPTTTDVGAAGQATAGRVPAGQLSLVAWTGPDSGAPRDGRDLNAGALDGSPAPSDGSADRGRPRQPTVPQLDQPGWSVAPWPLVTFGGIPEDPVPFDQPVLVTWTESRSRTVLASQMLIIDQAPFVDGACAAFEHALVVPAPADHVAAEGTLASGRCYRYTIHMVMEGLDATDQVSRPLWVAAPPEPFYRLDLLRDGMYSPQQTWTWCTAASVQMMANMVQDRQDTSYSGQLAIIGYEHAHDRYPSAVAGSDPQGMVAALGSFGAGSYHWSRNTTSDDALREAAYAIRTSKRPASLFVNWGTHAWVMSGFTATADPLVSDDWQLTGVYVEGPLYPRQALKRGFYDPPPDQWYSIETMRTVMLPYWETIAPSTSLWQGAVVTAIPDGG